MVAEDHYECANCGEELKLDMKSCPRCGSTKRKVFIVVTDSITLRNSLQGKKRDVSGKIKEKFYVRSKVSRKGKEAKEILTINKEKMRKYHQVEELDEHGNWIVVYDEEKPLLRKHKK